RVPNRAGPAVELGAGRAPETAAREDRLLEIADEAVAEGTQAFLARPLLRGRCDHVGEEALRGLLNRRQLQLLLGAEKAEQAALRHLQLGGEASDRQPFEAFLRGEVDGPVEDRLTGCRLCHGRHRPRIAHERSCAMLRALSTSSKETS